MSSKHGYKKRADAESAGGGDNGDETAAVAVNGRISAYTTALTKSIVSIVVDGADAVDKVALVDESVAQYTAALLELIDPDGTITETHKGVTHMPDKNEEVVKGLSPEQAVAVSKAIADAAEKAAADAEKVTKAMGDRLEAVEKKNAALIEDIAKRERVAKATKLVGDAPVKVEDVEKLLQVAGVDGEAVVADILAKLNGAMKAGSTLAELGREAGGENTDPNSASAKIAKFVEDIRKSEPKLTAQAAYAKALTDHPELYEALDDEEK
jgi:hypothetical protein